MSINNVHGEDVCFTSVWVWLLCTMMKSTLFKKKKKSLSVCSFFNICLCMNVFLYEGLYQCPFILIFFCMFMLRFVPVCFLVFVCVFKSMLTCMYLLVLVFACLDLSRFASTCLCLPMSAYSCPYLPVSSCISWCDLNAVLTPGSHQSMLLHFCLYSVCVSQ